MPKPNSVDYAINHYQIYDAYTCIFVSCFQQDMDLQNIK